MTITRISRQAENITTSGADLNDMKRGDLWWGSNFTNAPNTNWFTVEMFSSIQIAYEYTGITAAPKVYVRSHINNSWQPWKRLIAVGDSIQDISWPSGYNLTATANQCLITKRTDYNASKNPSSSMWMDSVVGQDSTGAGRFNLRQVAHADGYQGVQLEAHRVVGSTNYYNGVRMEINGSGAYRVNVSNAAAWRSGIGAAASSDRRLKSDIEPLGDDAVDFISKLEPVVYTINGERQVGLIAQDVNEADPWGTRMAFETQEGIDGLDDWEKMDDGSPTWKLDYIRIIAPLVATVQDLSANVEALTDRVKELEDKLADRQ